MKVFSVRFVNNETNSVFSVTQFGESCNEIEVFWRSYFKNGRKDKYTFVDCELFSEDMKAS